MIPPEEMVRLISCIQPMAYSICQNLSATSMQEATSGVARRASSGSGGAAHSPAGITPTERDPTCIESPKVYAPSVNGNNSLQQVIPPYTVTANSGAESPTFVVAKQLTALELEWLVSRLDVGSPVLCENELVSSNRLAQNDFCCEGSQESSAFQEPKETSRTSKSSTSLGSAPRESQGRGRTSHSSSSTIDSDVHMPEQPADPLPLDGAHGALLSDTALAGWCTTLPPNTLRPLGGSAARAMPSLIPISGFPVENLRSCTSRSPVSQERFDRTDTSAPWRNEGLYTNLNTQQTMTPDAGANGQVRENFTGSGRGRDGTFRMHGRHLHSPAQHNQPACAVQGLWLPRHPLSDGEDMAFRTPRMVLEGAAADKKLPARVYTESAVQAYGKESYNEDTPLRSSHHGIYAQTSVYKCEVADPPPRVWPATFDSYYTPSGILRFPLNPRIVTLPVVVELRYLRFDARVSESYLEIPLINFFIAR